MASDNGVDSLQDQLEGICRHHSQEFDLTMAEIIGTLEFVKAKFLYLQLSEDEEDAEDIP
jgi:hypothetical protein